MLTPRRAGARRHRVDLQSITARVASGDGYTDTWTTYATPFASIVPASASTVERLSANMQQVPVTHIVEIDYASTLRASHRVKFGTRYLYIQGIQNQDERNLTHVLACEERVQ